LARQVRQVAAIFFQRGVRAFRRLARHALCAAHLAQAISSASRVRPGLLQDAAGGTARVLEQREQQMLGGNVFVAELRQFIVRADEHGSQARREREMHIAAHARQPVDLGAELLYQDAAAMLSLPSVCGTTPSD